MSTPDRTSRQAHWSDPETIEHFATRDADLRLAALLEAEEDAALLRVLDLGCAGGRNADLLARRGCDVHAVDLSEAMVERTRSRLAAVLGEDEAARRVRAGAMRDLAVFEDGSFDLIVALGILHQAGSRREWEETLAEVARVVRPGGRLLVANFAPGTGQVDAPRAEPDAEGLYDAFDSGPLSLRTVDELDADLAQVGFRTLVESRLVERVVEDRRRVTVNALYVRDS